MFRIFSDSNGNEWQVFDVVPRSTERRSSERRSDGGDIPGEEKNTERRERRERHRRLTVGGSISRVAGRQGWLVFERGSDRRRLMAIPEAWRTASDAELSGYRDAAKPILRRHRQPA